MAASRRLRRRITTLPMHKDLLQGEHLRSDDHSEFHKIRKKNSPLVGDVSLRWCVSLDLFRGSVDQLTEIVSDCVCAAQNNLIQQFILATSTLNIYSEALEINH